MNKENISNNFKTKDLVMIKEKIKDELSVSIKYGMILELNEKYEGRETIRTIDSFGHEDYTYYKDIILIKKIEEDNMPNWNLTKDYINECYFIDNSKDKLQKEIKSMEEKIKEISDRKKDILSIHLPKIEVINNPNVEDIIVHKFIDNLLDEKLGKNRTIHNNKYEIIIDSYNYAKVPIKLVILKKYKFNQIQFLQFLSNIPTEFKINNITESQFMISLNEQTDSDCYYDSINKEDMVIESSFLNFESPIKYISKTYLHRENEITTITKKYEMDINYSINKNETIKQFEIVLNCLFDKVKNVI